MLEVIPHNVPYMTVYPCDKYNFVCCSCVIRLSNNNVLYDTSSKPLHSLVNPSLSGSKFTRYLLTTRNRHCITSLTRWADSIFIFSNLIELLVTFVEFLYKRISPFSHTNVVEVSKKAITP